MFPEKKRFFLFYFFSFHQIENFCIYMAAVSIFFHKRSSFDYSLIFFLIFGIKFSKMIILHHFLMFNILLTITFMDFIFIIQEVKVPKLDILEGTIQIPCVNGFS